MGSFSGGGSGGGFGGGGGGGGDSAFSFGGSSGAFNASSSSYSSSASAFNAYSWGSSGYNHHNRYYATQNADTPLLVPYDSWSSRDLRNCITVAVLFGLLAGSLFLIFGVYGSTQVEMGVNYSRILKANKLFVESISVRNPEQVPGARLYLFENQPVLNNTKEWVVDHNVVMSGYHHQEWAFWLNCGSKVNMVYDLPPTSSLFIIVARGINNFNHWIEDPFNSDSCLLWKSVQGHGQINFKADSDDNYYFGLGNINEKSLEMTLQMEIKSKIYETETANSWCSLDLNFCEVVLSLRGSEVGLLTTPDKPKEGLDVWEVNISYKTRWQTYLILNGALLFATFLISSFLFESRNLPNLHPEETPPDSQKDAFSHTGEAILSSNPVVYNEPNFKRSSKANPVVEETSEENLCIICFEDDKNSFFQPCGHCATCYGCGLRIKEASGHCPICRKPIQDIGKIFRA